jgi:hypothetical protein
LVSSNRLNNLYLVNSLHDRLSNAPADATEVGHNKYVWIEGFGRHASVSRNDVGYHTTAEGITAGAEYRPAWHNTTVGLALSFSNESLKAKGATTGNTNSLSVAAYGGFDLNYMRLDASAFYNTYKSSLKRDFGTSGAAQAKPDGEANGISIQLSHAYVTGLVTPYIRGVYTRQHLAGATENGSALLNLQYDAINANTFVGDVGFRIDPTRYLHSEKTKLLINIALEHDFSTLGETVTGLFPITTGQTWSAYWRGDSENTALVGIDVARQITDGLEVTGRLNGRASLYQTSGELSLAAKYRF